MEHHLKNYIPYHHKHYTAHHLQIKLRITLKGLRKKGEPGYRVSWEPHRKPSTGKVKTLRRDLGALLDLCIMLEPHGWRVILAQGPCFNGPGNVILAQGPCFNGPDKRPWCTSRFVRIGCTNTETMPKSKSWLRCSHHHSVPNHAKRNHAQSEKQQGPTSPFGD